MSVGELVAHSLVYGFGMSLLIGILVVVSMWINAEMWLGDYPPEIQKTFGSVSSKAKKQKGIVSILFLVATILPIVISLIQLEKQTSQPLGFAPVFWNVFIIMLTFDTFDLLVLDWLMFVVITPRFIVLQGTEGHPAYKDILFHAKGFVKGLVIAVIVGIFSALIFQLF